MNISSEKELEELYLSMTTKNTLNEISYSKTRYISVPEFQLLKRYDLDFEPYNSIALECKMNRISILQSKTTKRFYIGYLNLGGHGAFGVIRPVRLKEITNLKYIKEMYENHGEKMNLTVDLNVDYEI